MPMSMQSAQPSASPIRVRVPNRRSACSLVSASLQDPSLPRRPPVVVPKSGTIQNGRRASQSRDKNTQSAQFGSGYFTDKKDGPRAPPKPPVVAARPPAAVAAPGKNNHKSLFEYADQQDAMAMASSGGAMSSAAMQPSGSKPQKFDSLFEYADQQDALAASGGAMQLSGTNPKGLIITTPRRRADEERQSKARIAKQRWDEACAREEAEAGKPSSQAPWGEDEGPRSPAQRIKAHRGALPPLPDDDSAAPLPDTDSEEDVPLRTGRRGVSARRLKDSRGQDKKQDKNSMNQQAMAQLAQNMTSQGAPLRMDLIQEGAPYVRSIQNQGDILGYDFKRGDQGIGYYRQGGGSAPEMKPAAGSSTRQTRGASSIGGGNAVSFPRQRSQDSRSSNAGGIGGKHKDTCIW